MKRRMIWALALAFGLIVLLAVPAMTDADRGGGRGGNNFKADLEGFQEPPAVSSTGSGEFRARIARDEVEFELSYEDLEGTVQQAHIHLGQEGVNGGIVLFLCSNLPGAPPGTQPCPVPSGTVTGTLTADDVRPVPPQGIAAGELDEVIRAMREEVTYANVHTTKHPGGEIRGQIGHGRGHGR